MRNFNVEAFEYHKAGITVQVNLLKKLYLGRHFIDTINRNRVGVLQWHLTCSFLYQSLPNKLDYLEKIQVIQKRQN